MNSKGMVSDTKTGHMGLSRYLTAKNQEAPDKEWHISGPGKAVAASLLLSSDPFPITSDRVTFLNHSWENSQLKPLVSEIASLYQRSILQGQNNSLSSHVALLTRIC